MPEADWQTIEVTITNGGSEENEKGFDIRRVDSPEPFSPIDNGGTPAKSKGASKWWPRGKGSKGRAAKEAEEITDDDASSDTGSLATSSTFKAKTRCTPPSNRIVLYWSYGHFQGCPFYRVSSVPFQFYWEIPGLTAVWYEKMF